jgi:ADP-ribose pyrophosphatase
MKKWKILSSKEIFSHPRLILVEDEVLLPNGHETNYLKYKDRIDAVSIVCKRKDGKILLEKEYSHPPQKWLFQFPGGGVSKGENPKKGANRELMEEAKYRAGKITKTGSYLLNNRRSTAKMHVFLATDIKKEARDGDKEEDIKIFWFSEKQIEEMIKEGKIINSHVLASWILYKLRR